MIHRCIMIFPNFHNVKVIQDIRKKFDPQYKLVDPHITLVFPFYSELTSHEIKEHILSSIEGISPFEMKLRGITGEDGGYLFLNVIQGKEEIKKIHSSLYQGVLKQYYSPLFTETEYKPHLTVGRIESKEKYDEALEECRSINELFEERVREISVEIIDEDGNSNIEMTIPL